MKEVSRRQFIATGAATAASAVSIPALEPIKRMNQHAKLKLSLAAYSFRQSLPMYRGGKEPKKTEMDILDFVDYCAVQNLDGAEITAYFIPDPTPNELINQIKHRAAINGLDISGGAVGNRFSFPKGPGAEKEMKSIESWLQTYARMGAPAIRVFAGHPQKGQDAKDAIENIIRNLNAASKLAEKYGVMLAIENHDFTTNLDLLMDILKGVDSPWIGLNLDSGNLAKTADPYKDIARMAPYAVNAQIKVKIPVNGKKEEADFDRLIGIMKDSGYRGYIVLEYEEGDPEKHIPIYLDKLRKAMA